MRVLTVDECSTWFRDRNLRLLPAEAIGRDHRLVLPDDYGMLRFETPRDGRGQAGLAHLLSQWFDCDRSILLVNVVTLFQPHELDALLSLRRYYGETRWVDGVPGGATPGHLFEDGPPHDQRNVRDFLLAMFAFIFQGYFVRRDGNVIVWVADEVVEIRSSSREDLAGPQEVIRTLGLQAF